MLHPIRLVIFGFTLLCLSACDGNGAREIQIQGNTITTPLPDNIREIARLGTVPLAVQVTINGADPRRQPVAADNVPEEIMVSATVPADRSNNVRVEWLAFPDNTEVLLADYVTDTQPNQESLTVSLYNDTGERFDYDDDGLTNLQEVRENRNPLGEFDLSVPRRTSFLGANRELIQGNADSDISGDVADPDTNSKFSLRHDGTNMYLYLCGNDEELRGDGTANNPDAYWHDDAIFLYIDGADSDTSTYDNIDDFQLVFLRSTQELRVTASRGGQNQFCPAGSCVTDFNFEPNPGTTECVYELFVTLPMADLNITVGEPVGFDLELTDDDNGDQREGSSGFVGFDDRSDQDPSTFAKIILEP